MEPKVEQSRKESANTSFDYNGYHVRIHRTHGNLFSSDAEHSDPIVECGFIWSNEYRNSSGKRRAFAEVRQEIDRRNKAREAKGDIHPTQP